MKKIEAIHQEIIDTTVDVDGLSDLGRHLVSINPDQYEAVIRNGMSYEEIGHTHFEEQLRLYFIYTIDRDFWLQLLKRLAQLANEDPHPLAPTFSKWKSLLDDMTDNVGWKFGWVDGTDRHLASTTFAQRLKMVDNVYSSMLNASQIHAMGVSLGLEEGVAPPKSAGSCYVATAVYGDYHAPEVRVLRRWRDEALHSSALGRQFVKLYYAISPRIVRGLGNKKWFVEPSRALLNRLVLALQRSGYTDSPYKDRLR